MKEIIRQAGNFVRKNPTIISSLFLIVVVIGALFLNSYITLNRFQKNLDKTLRTKAVLAENITDVMARDYFSNLSANADQLQEKINEIQKRSPEIVQMSIYSLNTEENVFIPIASTEQNIPESEQQNEMEKEIAEKARKFASTGSDAFAYASNAGGERFWNIVKAVRSENNAAQGIVSLKLSLAESDVLSEKTIWQTYLISIVAMIFVLLLVLNHIRLFAFEVKAKKLEEVDKMKDDFISMASHELKSPLTAIRGYSELLGDVLEKNAEQKKYLENINISVDRLKTLVEDLLNVSRIEQNRLPIECKPISIKEIVIGIINEMQSLADQKNLALKNNLQTEALVNADPERTKQIVANLISNAIKYTPSGSVEIQSKEDDQWVFLTVADTGLGISTENMKNLFAKFYRIKTEKTEKIAGTGLGLWISRELARKMDGDLDVSSIEGVGSHFTLKLKKIK